MHILRMALCEIREHKLNFSLGLLSVLVAGGCIGGLATVLRAHDLRSQDILETKEAEVKEAMAKLEDDYRIITKEMGFNVLILPKNQNLSEFYAENYASEFMPESYVDTLANSKVVTIQHLLPSIQQKIKWPERNRTILLTGVRDEVPIAYRSPVLPLLQPVPDGGMTVGHELHKSLGLKMGDRLQLMGREFEVTELQPERGDIDDITVWIALDAAQELLGKEGKINAILALECSCAWADLPQVRAELAKILPGTQVIEKRSQALARAETRWRAAEETKSAVAREKENRAVLRAERENLAAILVPLVVLIAGFWIGLLAWANVRDRRYEIGVLRAIGLRSHQVLLLFLTRSTFLGALGGVLGYLIGWGVGAGWNGLSPERAGTAMQLLDPALLGATALLAPLVSTLAGWIPAQLAAIQDPAEVLRSE